jgi:hypothetical protein
VNTDFAFICDYAEAGTKLNALGIGFDTLYARHVPVKHNHFSFVMQIRSTIVETGAKRLEVHIIDEDGKDILPPIMGSFNVQMKENTTQAVGRIVVEFGNMEFKQYGTYSVRAAVEGIEMASIDFRVVEPPSTPGQQSPGQIS